MKKKSQTDVIIDAFKADIPKDKDKWPDYYKKRMDICASCERNTANGAWGKAVAFAASRTNKAQCSVCLCCINEKCWSLNEACGLEEIGENPKWSRLLVETVDKDLFNISNLSPDICNIDLSENGNEFEADFGEVYEDQEVDINIRVECKKDYIITNRSMCGCMSMTASPVVNGVYNLSIHLNNPIQIGPYNRTVLLDFMDEQEYKDESTQYGEKNRYPFIIRIKGNVLKTQGDVKQDEDPEDGSTKGDNKPSE